MFSIRLALKNLSRHKRRNFITIFNWIRFWLSFAESIMNRNGRDVFDNIKDFETGDIQITNTHYWQEREDFPLDNLVEWNEDFYDFVAQGAEWKESLLKCVFSDAQ